MQLLSYSRFLLQNSNLLQPSVNSSFSCRQIFSVSDIKLNSLWNRNVNFRTHFNLKTGYDQGKNGKMSYANILFYSFKEALKRMPVILKGHSMNIVKHCAEQCEFIIAHRIRRSQQIISLYTKIWDEIALKQFLNRLRRKLAKKGKYMLLSVAAYNWEQERISDEEILRYQNEMKLIKELKEKKYCRKDKVGGKCSCFNCLEPGDSVASSDENEAVKVNSSCCKTNTSDFIINHNLTMSNSEPEWNVFVNEENLTVWKKEEINHIGEGLFCYKLYGRYEDVTALDFLEAQVDLDYRLAWDDHAVKLQTIDTERSSRSDVIYWETKWPTPFSNRDYVFKRRYLIDKNNKLVYLVNKSTEHPSCPVYPNKQRVKEYWSYMIIKPFDDVDKPGLEFSLTYFDNPGMAMPSTLSSYVTVTGMPVFLKNLHNAAKSLKDKRKGPSILFDDDASDDSKRPRKGDKSKPPSSSDDDGPKEPKKKCPKLPDMTNFERISDGFFFF